MQSWSTYHDDLKESSFKMENNIVYEVSTVAEKGRAFYCQNFQKWSFPTVVISDYEYFSLPKFLDMGFSYSDIKSAQCCAQ